MVKLTFPAVVVGSCNVCYNVFAAFFLNKLLLISFCVWFFDRSILYIKLVQIFKSLFMQLSAKRIKENDEQESNKSN